MAKPAPLEAERFWEWVAEPDACDFCQDMDGTVHPIDEPMDTHPNCRCTMNILEKAYTLEDLVDNSLPLEVQMRGAENAAELAAQLKLESERLKRVVENQRLLGRGVTLAPGTTVKRLPDIVENGVTIARYKTDKGTIIKVFGEFPAQLTTAEAENLLLGQKLLTGGIPNALPLLPAGTENALVVERSLTVSELNRAKAAINRLAIVGARFDEEFRSEIVQAAIQAGASNFTAEHFNVVKSLGDVPAKYWLQKSIEKNWDITEMRKQIKIYKSNIRK